MEPDRRCIRKGDATKVGGAYDLINLRKSMPTYPRNRCDCCKRSNLNFKVVSKRRFAKNFSRATVTADGPNETSYTHSKPHKTPQLRKPESVVVGSGRTVKWEETADSAYSQSNTLKSWDGFSRQ